MEITHPWGAYARLQSQLSRRSRIDDHAWGEEAALDFILTSMLDSNPSSPEDIQRAAANGARQARYRARLRAMHVQDVELLEDSISSGAEACQALALIRSAVMDDDWRLLLGVAAGYDYKELTLRLNVTAGGLRTRTSRLRRELARIAA